MSPTLESFIDELSYPGVLEAEFREGLGYKIKRDSRFDPNQYALSMYKKGESFPLQAASQLLQKTDYVPLKQDKLNNPDEYARPDPLEIDMLDFDTEIMSYLVHRTKTTPFQFKLPKDLETGLAKEAHSLTHGSDKYFSGKGMFFKQLGNGEYVDLLSEADLKVGADRALYDFFNSGDVTMAQDDKGLIYFRTDGDIYNELPSVVYIPQKNTYRMTNSKEMWQLTPDYK